MTRPTMIDYPPPWPPQRRYGRRQCLRERLHDGDHLYTYNTIFAKQWIHYWSTHSEKFMRKYRCPEHVAGPRGAYKIRSGRMSEAVVSSAEFNRRMNRRYYGPGSNRGPRRRYCPIKNCWRPCKPNLYAHHVHRVHWQCPFCPRATTDFEKHMAKRHRKVAKKGWRPEEATVFAKPIIGWKKIS